MTLCRDDLAAIGLIAIETAWMDYQIARLVMISRRAGGNEAERQIRLLLQKRPRFEEAEEAIAAFRDADAAARSRAWLEEVKVLREKRHQLVHSIVMDEHRPGFTGFWPVGERVVSATTDDLRELARRVKAHADEGTILSLEDWPIQLGRQQS